jgi:hypothetical protein
MEYSAYEEATVPICSFVLRNGKMNLKALCFKLSDFRGGMAIQNQKVSEALCNPYCGYFFESEHDNFFKIPGNPIAYWIPSATIKIFEGAKLKDYVKGTVGIQTGDNDKFIHLWWEVRIDDILFTANSVSDSYREKKWFPYNKGGDYRKWYGNDFAIINWKNDGEDIKKNSAENGCHYQQYSDLFKFKPLLTWTRITSSKPSFRIKSSGFLSDMAGFSLFGDNNHLKNLVAYCNSAVVSFYLDFFSPTMNIMLGSVLNLPYVVNNKFSSKISSLVDEVCEFSKNDWDSFEISWNFDKHPFIRKEKLISEAYRLWSNECRQNFTKLKANEEELNRIFIEIYNLQDELSPTVDDKDVTVHQADMKRDIKSFISYAVGCMFGRYSLDVPGLVYAGGTFEPSKYTSFPADADAILPICDDEYFEDDIVGLFIRFVEKVYGKETIEENLQFIADALGGKGTSREVIRAYFINDFYVDHCATYQVKGFGKRPIYWLFDSGKKNGFKCLIYIHRYKPDTIARIRTDYIHEQQSRYRTAIEDLTRRIDGASPSEKVRFNKQLTKVMDQDDELRIYEEKIHHLADQMIEIDLDDGVKVNYAKFQDVLAKIKIK